MTDTETTLVNLLLDLRRRLVVCQLIAYREIQLTTSNTAVKAGRAASPPLPIDSTAWDALTDTEDILQEMWASLGHRVSGPWNWLITALLSDITALAASALADQWIADLRAALRRLGPITDRPAEGHGTISATPAMLSQYADIHLHAQVNVTTIRSWLRRGVLDSRALGDGYYQVQADEFKNLLCERGYITE